MDAEAIAALGLKPSMSRVDPPVGPRDVAAILDAALAASPDAEALADACRRYSYAALDRAADSAAHLFTSMGLAAGDRIAASLPNGCDIVIAFLAAQRIGAIWVGINRVLSPAEKRHILGHSGARLLIADREAAMAIADDRPALPALARIVAVDGTEWTDAISTPRPFARAPIDPFAPAAIMYTSGTTGAPKGVVHSQHNMVTLCAAASAEGLLHPEARRGVILPLTITNLMILGPLMAFWNGTACICGTTAKVAPLVEWLRREAIGTCATVPTIVYDLLQADLDLPPAFRMGAGGAPLPEPIRQAFLRRHGYPIGGSYGLTEAPTVVAETRGLQPPAGSSGLALPHLEVTIRDADGAILPAGEIGEVCVGPVREGRWAGVYTPALGYWREPEKSAALLKDGVLHTSDMGSLDAGGWLTLADRSSELILRGGSNVYPAEVERVLHDHPGVAACALVGKPDLRLGMRTVAFVQPKAADADQARLREELAALCRESLARYKMPDEWIFVGEFPRNAMGKIVKPALRARIAETVEA